ncbi:MAG TPA: cupin domain-containing protein [Pyrinomonadaceae bacterium]
MVINSLAKLLEPLTEEEFLASFWGKNYKHVRGGAGKFTEMMPWAHLNYVLRHHRLDFPRLRLVQDGERPPVASYIRYVKGRQGRLTPRLRPAEINNYLRQGATVVLDAVDELHEPTEELAAVLERFFCERVQINLYAGWQTSRGFDLHWDDHDVFILQVAGRKRWSVYGMTRPYPVADDIEEAQKPTDAPVWEETLEDGDLLYIPRGWWHVAQPLAEPTLHLTVGIHQRTGLDLMRWLTERLRARATFRQDMPRLANADERATHAARLRQELLAELDDAVLERFFREHDATAESRARFSLPSSATAEALPDAPDTLLRWMPPRPLELKAENGVVEFACHKKRWRFAEDALLVLQPLEERRVCSVAELCETAAVRLDARTVRAFLRELLLHGLVAVVDR